MSCLWPGVFDLFFIIFIRSGFLYYFSFNDTWDILHGHCIICKLPIFSWTRVWIWLSYICIGQICILKVQSRNKKNKLLVHVY